MRILIVEDDDVLAQVLALSLTGHHYAVDVATDGEAGWDYAQTVTYDLIMLDVDLPRLDGLTLCRRLRQQGYTGPMLLLTAKASNADKVEGLDAGADDYVVKPCSTEELCARIRALLRRGETGSTPLLQWGGLCVNPTSYEVTYYGQSISLSAKEYSLLELFLRSPRRVFSSSVILEHIWAFDDSPGEDTVRAHIKRLRKKLKAAGAEDVIETIYGIGYRLNASTKQEPAASSPAAPAPEAIASNPEPSPSSPADRARRMAVDLWEQFKQPTLERLTILDQAVSALQRDNWSEAIRHEAERAAHKLAGSLGMFGLPAGSAVARDLEAWLQQAAQGLTDVAHFEVGVARLHEVIQSPPLPHGTEPSSVNAVDRAEGARSPGPLLLVITADESFAAAFMHQAAIRGMKTELVRTGEQARGQFLQLHPQVVIFHWSQPELDPELAQFFTLYQSAPVEVPLVVVTPPNDRGDRPLSSFPNLVACLSSTLPMPEIMEVVHDLTRPNRTAARVMTVDDDPLILSTLEQMLPAWGIEVRALNDPSQFWEVLTLTSPDLLILDIEMPLVNGLELCQVVRNDATWNGLPILFLSSRRDADTIRQIYSIGADDYVAKPFTEPELVTRIFNRLERTRLLKHRAEIDLLTGVLNRQQGIKELHRQLRLAQLRQQPMGVALLNVDRLKEINLRYGYDTGDRVLQQVASVLQRSLPADALLIRWDGTAFMVGLRGMPLSAIEQQLEQGMNALRDSPLESPALPITLSGGLANLPQHGQTLQSLYCLLDRLMTEARATGGDRLLIAP